MSTYLSIFANAVVNSTVAATQGRKSSPSGGNIIIHFHFITGFSFTENESGNVHSAPGAASDIHSFLIQFFQLFPNLILNDFYNGGVSYGGK